MTPPFTSFSFYRSSEAGSYDHPTFSLQTTASPHVLISHLSTHTFGRGVCVPRQRVCAAPLAGVEARGERAKAIEGEQQPHVPCSSWSTYTDTVQRTSRCARRGGRETCACAVEFYEPRPSRLGLSRDMLLDAVNAHTCTHNREQTRTGRGDEARQSVCCGKGKPSGQRSSGEAFRLQRLCFSCQRVGLKSSKLA